MSDNIINPDINEAPVTGTEAEPETPSEGEQAEPSQDPVELELKKVKQPKRTKAEKIRFSIKKMQEQLASLGEIDETNVEEEPLEEDKPVTLGMLKKLESEKAQKTALQLADSIENANERELAKHYLENTIKPSGNPEADFKTALALVNSVRNSKIAQEATRKPQASRLGTGGAPAKQETEFNPTAEEANMMKWAGLTKEDILKARQRSQEGQN